MKLKEIDSPVPGCAAYRSNNNLAIICGREPCGPAGAMRWHLSISHHHRNPTWEEIRDARYVLIPEDVMVAMFLPPRTEYVNAHRYCFHLYEIEAADMPKNLT
jgi:hypothetical protein